MRVAGFVMSAMMIGLAGPAFAQSGNGQTAGGTAPNQAAASQSTANPSSSGNPRGWMASGYLGANFGAGSSRDGVGAFEDLDLIDNSNSTAANFGFQVGYLAKGVIGGEFLADFSPNLGVFNNVLFSKTPSVNSYMFNAIAAAPFGQVQNYDPYVSGGVGTITLSTNVFTIDPRLDLVGARTTLNVNDSSFGWNLGGGIMAWSERNWGFRGDIRYYKSHGDDNTIFDLSNIGDGTVITRAELAGLSFWKANMGIAFRF